jgi:hypothetical protein
VGIEAAESGLLNQLISLGHSQAGKMPIRGLWDVVGGAFDPEDINALIAAQEIVLQRLNVVDRKSPTAFLVAKTIIQIAKDGERDPDRLSERAVEHLKSSGVA